jgi:hypothetical protein
VEKLVERGERVEPPLAGDVPQFCWAAVFDLDAGAGHEILDSLGDEDVAW